MGRFDTDNIIFRHAENFKTFEKKTAKDNGISFEIFGNILFVKMGFQNYIMKKNNKLNRLSHTSSAPLWKHKNLCQFF
jgi:hypothetical protein